MALKTFKPYTKSTRGTVVIDKVLYEGAFKPLLKVKTSLAEKQLWPNYLTTHGR